HRRGGRGGAEEPRHRGGTDAGTGRGARAARAAGRGAGARPPPPLPHLPGAAARAAGAHGRGGGRLAAGARPGGRHRGAALHPAPARTARGVRRGFQPFAESLLPDRSSAAAMASSQLSLATGVPSWVGRTPSASVMPGVRRYIDTIDPENAARPRPAIRVGTNGSSREAPTAISP